MWRHAVSEKILPALMGVLLALPVQADDKLQILGIFYRGCEQACEGFRDGIAASGLNAEVIIRDIAQDMSRLPAIIEEARALPADLVLTYGTSVTRGVVGTLDDADDPRFLSGIPVVFTVVADPFGTRIAAGFEGSGRANVTGTFNRVPESVNLEVIRQYDPGFSRLGLLYNLNEPNSVLKLEELRELAPGPGIELVALALDPDGSRVPDVASIPARMAELRDRDVRWVYLGSSSFLYQNGDLFTASAVDNGIAILSPYEDLVRENQALLSVAARYHDIGRLAADQVVRILRDGVSPGDLPIAQVTDFAYVVNMDVARKLDRYPPFAFLQVAETVGN